MNEEDFEANWDGRLEAEMNEMTSNEQWEMKCLRIVFGGDTEDGFVRREEVIFNLGSPGKGKIAVALRAEGHCSGDRT